VQFISNDVQQLEVPQKLLAFYRNRRFVTVLITASNYPLF